MSHEELPAGHYHHFEPEQAYNASKFGMWLFLVSEVHMFGGLFLCFAVFRGKNLEHFIESAHQLNWQLGALNTLVLLASSYTMVLGVDAAQRGNNKRCANMIGVTILLALAFFVVKYVEYSAKFAHGIYPDSGVFWGLYFAMTGLHGFHVFAGIVVLVWLWLLARKERFSTEYYTPVEVVGLYWHIVDIIWIFLFPIVYLLAGAEIGGGAAH